MMEKRQAAAKATADEESKSAAANSGDQEVAD